MANQYNFKGNDEFEQRRQEVKSKATGFKVIAFIIFACIALFMVSTVQSRNMSGNFFPIFVIGGLIYAGVTMIGEHYDKEAKSMGAATSGREIVKQSLSALPDDYNVLSNVELNHAGKNTVFDTIVVGSNGVFVVGTCNRNGKLDGQENSETWVQHKVGRGGTPYSNEFKNPFKKIYFQKRFLEQFLRDNGIPVKVAGYLILPLAESYTCTSSNIGKNQQDVTNKIMTNKKANLDPEKVSEIIYSLKNNQ